MNDDAERELEALSAEARYRRTRLALYRARIYAQRATSPAALRALERALEGAEDRLRRGKLRAAAQAAEAAGEPDGGEPGGRA